MFNQQTAIELLKQGNNGNEILSILDVIADEYNNGEMVDYQGNPTSVWYSMIDVSMLLMLY
mgnify:FL=1